jgi:hypothetical protein
MDICVGKRCATMPLIREGESDTELEKERGRE